MMRSDSDQPTVREPAQGRRMAPRALPILLGVGAGLALCALVYFALTFFNGPTPSDPAPTARAICADLTSKSYGPLYGLLATDLQRQGTQTQFVASQRELDSLLGPVHTCAATVNATSGASASVTLTLQRGQATPASAPLSLTFAQGTWRVTAYDQNI